MKLHYLVFVLLFGACEREKLNPELALASVATGPDVTLRWDASAGPNLAGYKVNYGTASQTYTQHVDVGNVTTYGVMGLTPGILYFFAANSYNASGQESGFSNEVVFRPASPTPGPSATVGPTPAVTATPIKTPSPAPSSTPPKTPTPAPLPTPSPGNGPSVTSLKLVRNSPGGTVVMDLVNGSVINISTLPTQNLNVQGFTSNGTSGTIRFILDTSIDHTEATSPYAMCGDWDPCPPNTLLKPGNHFLAVQAASATGLPGPIKSVSYSVVSASPTATVSPAPIASPSPSPIASPSPSPSCTPCPCGNK